MNKPPDEFIRVAPDKLRDFVQALFRAGGLDEDDAALISELLVTNDLRGIFSHGTRQTVAYVGHFREGRLNPRPDVQQVDDTGSTLVFDGDGGLGYFPSHRLAHALAERAREHGIVAGTTRNHGHFGAAGIYSRIIAQHHLVAWVTSGHQLNLTPEHSVRNAAGGSPMSFAIPAGEEPPMVVDFGAMHDLYDGSPHLDELIRLAPGTVFRSIGLGAVCQSMGGFLAGVPVDPERAERQWSGANQGSFMVATDVERFMPVEQFQRETAEYSRQVRTLKPLPGHGPAVLPGGMEWSRERQWAEEGIPVSAAHQQALEGLAADLDVASPFAS